LKAIAELHLQKLNQKQQLFDWHDSSRHRPVSQAHWCPFHGWSSQKNKDSV